MFEHFSRFKSACYHRIEQRRAITHLEGLDARMLRDIGLRRNEIAEVVRTARHDGIW